MKLSTIISVVVVCGAIFWATGGGSLFRTYLAPPTELPDTIAPPNATFIGNEQTNPFAE